MTTDKLARRQSAQQSVLLGAAFEEWVNTQHEMAGLRGALAHVIHNMPPSKYINGRLMYEEAGVADFTGCLHGGGFLAAEAKSVAPGERLARKRISMKQELHLDAVTAAGGNSHAFLLVEFRAEAALLHRHYAIPWHQVPWKIVRSAESLDEKDIAQVFRVMPGDDYFKFYHPGSSRRYIVGDRVKHVYPTE